jgi:hypothetical protein
LEILRELMVHRTAVIEKGKLPAAIPSRTSANNRRSIASLLRSLSVRVFAEGKLESTVWIFRVIFSQQAFRAGTVASQCEADAPANTREMDQRKGCIVTDIFRNAHYDAPQPFGTPFLASHVRGNYGHTGRQIAPPTANASPQLFFCDCESSFSHTWNAPLS